MVITWYGQSCFKIQSGEIVIIIDPFDKKIGLNPPRQIGADLVLVTHNHYDHNNIGAISNEPFVIDGPGEYEIKGIEILGINSFHDEAAGAERGINTIYVFNVENIRIAHLGDLGQVKLTDEQVEILDRVDILMIPIGSVYTIDAEQAVTVINQLEPRIVIPMHYQIPGLNIKLDGVDKFLKVMGLDKKEASAKLTIKKKDLPQEGMEVLVMKI